MTQSVADSALKDQVNRTAFRRFDKEHMSRPDVASAAAAEHEPTQRYDHQRENENNYIYQKNSSI